MGKRVLGLHLYLAGTLSSVVLSTRVAKAGVAEEAGEEKLMSDGLRWRVRAYRIRSGRRFYAVEGFSFWHGWERMAEGYRTAIAARRAAAGWLGKEK